MSQHEFLIKLRIHIPFLRLIPDDIYFSLVSTEFVLPNKQLSKARDNLERQLGSFVMTYKADFCDVTAPLETHLCAQYRQATLSDKALSILVAYERIWKPRGVSFGVYAHPLDRILPSESAIGTLYSIHGYPVL